MSMSSPCIQCLGTPAESQLKLKPHSPARSQLERAKQTAISGDLSLPGEGLQRTYFSYDSQTCAFLEILSSSTPPCLWTCQTSPPTGDGKSLKGGGREGRLQAYSVTKNSSYLVLLCGQVAKIKPHYVAEYLDKRIC